jgi:lipopolysaccharide transport system ATP-binding protein
MSAPAIRAHELGKRYRVGLVENVMQRGLRRLARSGGVNFMWALRDATFDIDKGEAVGIIGRNGAGKSTLLKVLSRVTEPTAGYVDVAGRVGALLEVGTGFSGDLTGRENVYLNGAILGMNRAEVARKFDEIVAFSGVEQHIDTPVKWYSSGMYVRLAFAVAAHLEPEILIVDEVLAVGDAEFQKRCLGRMAEVARDGRTVLFVSHNMQLVRRLCQRGILLEKGEVRADGDLESVVKTYLASLDTNEEGRHSWIEKPLGDEDCRVIEIRVTDEHDLPQPTYFTSKPIYVTLELDLETVSPSLSVGIDIATVDGLIVFHTSFRDVPEHSAPEVAPGRNALRCEIPAELLNSGRYVVNLRISLHTIRWIVYADAVVHFDVLADHSESLFLIGASRPGVILPHVNWTAVEPGLTSERSTVPAPGTASASR